MSAEYGSLPFDEAIRFFRGKDLVPTDRWADVRKEEHDVAFMVAGAAKADLLADLHWAALKGVAKGTTLAEFRKDFDAIVTRHGWTGWKGESSDAGRAWRTRLIYDTNLRTSYQAGRWAQVQAGKQWRPYLIYRHSDLSTHPRPLHVSWDGLVVAVDDPWVQTHWPPNGWGCKCRMFALAERDLRRMGKTGPDTPPDDGSYDWTDKVTGEVHRVPNGIDPGWDYAPGASRTDLMRKEIERKVAKLPAGIGRQLKDELSLRFTQPAGEFTPYDTDYPSANPDISTPLKAAIIRFEDAVRSDLATEHAALLDSQGAILLQRSGQSDRVTFTHAELTPMAGATFSHNHPGGASFSLEDIALAAAYDFAEIRAVTALFRHSMAGPWPAEADLARVYAEEFPKAESEVRDRVKTGQLRAIHYGFEVRHRVWVRVASRLGLVYRREKS
jgi:hypothetical protein